MSVHKIIEPLAPTMPETPLPASEVMDLMVLNKSRRYEKAATAVASKPRKDWHIKAFKNPAENMIAVVQGASKKAQIHWPKLVILGLLGGSTW